MINLEETFEKYQDEWEFDKVTDRLNERKDLCAFLLLDKLVPSTEAIISAAEHDEVYLSTDCEKLAEIATEEDIITLRRCGVGYSSDGCLYMFV